MTGALIQPRRRVRYAVAPALVVMFAVLSALAPLTARAGAPGAPPAAVRLVLSLEVRTPQGSISLTGTGVVNRTGDGQFSLTLSGPEAHTIDVIHVDDTTYVSVDGGPYSVQDGSGGTGALPAGCMPASGAAGAPNLQALLGPGGGVQDLGPELLVGVGVEHIAVHGDLRSLLTQVAALLQQTAISCGVSSSSIPGIANLNSPEAQRVLAGSTLDLDLYVEQPNIFLRRLVLYIDVPGAMITLRLQVDATPLAAPVPVTAPS